LYIYVVSVGVIVCCTNITDVGGSRDCRPNPVSLQTFF
jgi:hypothetical protein